MTRPLVPSDIRGVIWFKDDSYSVSGGRVTAATSADSSATSMVLDSAQGPAYSATGLNSKATLTSGTPGTNTEGSNLMHIVMDVGYNWHWFGVIKPDATDDYHNLFEESGANCPMLWIRPGGQFEMNGAGTAIAPSSPTADDSTWFIASFINSDANSSPRARVRIIGADAGTGGDSVGGFNVGTGKTIQLWGRSDGNGYCGVQGANFAIASRAENDNLTSTEMAQLEGYFAWYYGLQGNLDAGHPYKSAAPTVDSDYGPATIKARGRQAGVSISGLVPGSIGAARGVHTSASILVALTVSMSAGGGAARGRQAVIASGNTIDIQKGTGYARGKAAFISSLTLAVGRAGASGRQASILSSGTVGCAIGRGVGTHQVVTFASTFTLNKGQSVARGRISSVGIPIIVSGQKGTGYGRGRPVTYVTMVTVNRGMVLAHGIPALVNFVNIGQFGYRKPSDEYLPRRFSASLAKRRNR